MICIKCGASIPEKSLFCNYCGAKQALTCSACGAELPQGSAFCNQCGTPVSAGVAVPEKKRRGRPTTKTAEEASPALVGCVPVIPADLRPSYSAWNQFCDWKNPYRSEVTGGAEYHFIRKDDKLYRLRPEDTKAKAVDGLPFVPNEMFWGDGVLWLVESDRESRSYRIYSLDPVNLECSLVVDLSELAKNYSVEAPYVTRTSICFKAYRSEGGYKLLRWDRKKGTLSTLYSEVTYMDIRGFGDGWVWIDDQNDEGKNIQLWIDDSGKQKPLYEQPDVAPLLPLIQETLGLRTVEDDKNRQMEWVSHFVAFLEPSALNFSKHAIDAGESAVRHDECIYRLPFGAAESKQAEIIWQKPHDLSKVWRDFEWQKKVRKTEHSWSQVSLFNGEYAAGTGSGSTNCDWCYQNAAGERIDLGRFNRGEGACALLGNMLYVKGDWGVGWCKFRLGHDVPKCCPVEFEE